MTRRLAREEGLFVGWSCGAAVFGALEYAKANLKEDDVMVVILPDHGTRYLAKIYNDAWMKDHGFLEREFSTARHIIERRNGKVALLTISEDTPVGEAVRLMNREGISQLPVSDVEGKEIVGSLIDARTLTRLIENPELKNSPVREIMEKPFAFVGLDSTLDVLASLINKENPALLVRDEAQNVHIITQQDLLEALTV
jgi:cystathionine beta-synthase